MGLLIVGYGLRDSISSVAKIQYDELQTYEASVYVSDDMDEETRKELQTYLDENENVDAHTSAHMSSITTQYEGEEVDAYLTVISDMELVEQFFVYQDRVSKSVTNSRMKA